VIPALAIFEALIAPAKLMAPSPKVRPLAINTDIEPGSDRVLHLGDLRSRGAGVGGSQRGELHTRHDCVKGAADDHERHREATEAILASLIEVLADRQESHSDQSGGEGGGEVNHTPARGSGNDFFGDGGLVR
jgi:hypothetical protein